jgi:hypothetical protein
MTQLFLKAKHWQIFMLLCGLPFITEIVTMPLLFGGNSMASISIMMLIILICLGGFLGWFWSIGTGLQQFIPENVRLKTAKFRFFLIYALVYMLLFSCLIIYTFASIHLISENTDVYGGMIFPLHFLAMFAMFYCLYFVAKTYKTVELQRTVTFSDYAGEFFLFWFFPVGIWVIQPKINAMISPLEVENQQ